MENASKALIMAGAILLAIMIISLSLMIYNNLAGEGKEILDVDEEVVRAFNAKLVPYTGNNVMGAQVNALLQYCVSSNIRVAQTGENYKHIYVQYPGGNIESNTYSRVDAAGKFYKVNGTYDENGMMTTIVITEVP